MEVEILDIIAVEELEPVHVYTETPPAYVHTEAPSSGAQPTTTSDAEQAHGVLMETFTSEDNNGASFPSKLPYRLRC